MIELSKRRNATTEDLIKVEAEISRTQSEIEQIEANAATWPSASPRKISRSHSKRIHRLRRAAAGARSLAILAAHDGRQRRRRPRLRRGQPTWIPVLLLAYYLGRFLWRRVESSRPSTRNHN